MAACAAADARPYDLAIVGAGPPDWPRPSTPHPTGCRRVLIERDVPGGQASHTSLIENFFGFLDGIGGAELARLAGRQAERFGAELHAATRRRRQQASRRNGRFELHVAGGHADRGAVVLAARGMVWRQLDVAACEELLERGVYYGAGRSEAAQCGGDDVVVIGAGNSAGQAVMNLGNAGARVTMVVRGDDLGQVDVRLSRRAGRGAPADRRAPAQPGHAVRRGRRLLAAVRSGMATAASRAAGAGAVHLHRRPAADRLGRRAGVRTDAVPATS